MSKKVKKIVYTEKGGKEVFGDVSANSAGIIQSMNKQKGPEATAEDIERKLGKFDFESTTASLGIDSERVVEEFKEWMNTDFSNLPKGRRFFRDVVLLKVFRYSGSYKYANLKPSSMRAEPIVEKKEGQGIFFPIARVLSVGLGAEDYGLSVGDIVELNDSVMGVVPNPTFDRWLEEKSGSTAGGVIGMDDAPPRFVKGDHELSDWVFNLDKLSEEEDPTVVLIPKVMIKTEASDVYIKKYS